MTSLRVSCLPVLVGITIFAQAPANRTQISGTITTIDAPANKITLKSDKGEEVSVSTSARTVFVKIPPGETDVKKGVKVTLADVAAGDRAVVIGPTGTDAKALTATSVLVMSKGDVATMQQKDVDEWKKRGANGNVTAVDAPAMTVTLKAGARTFTVKASDKTTFHRYALDSARFSDAKPSTIGEIKVGDQMRVLGNKSEDGATISAEKVVSGTFRQIAATISAVDPNTGTLTVKDLASKGNIIITVNSDSTMKKLPDTMAAMLGRRYAPGAQQGAAGAGAGRGGGRGGDVGQMLDSLPPMPLAELKKGDAIMITTTQGADAGHATVVMLLAGVEPLLTSPAAARDIMAGWSLGGGGGDQ